jgi:hypothetical protein
MRTTAALGVLCLALLPGPNARPQPPEAPAPRTPVRVEPRPGRAVVVFCVGVGRYTNDDDLNQLEYVAKDACAVWRRLQLIARVDTARSKLLVLDRRRPKDHPPLPCPGPARTELTRQDIDNEFGEFLSRLKDGDLVVVYFGGHGVIPDPKAGVHFCPSDYFEKKGIPHNELAMGGVFTKLAGAIGRHKGVQAVVFGNYCHAAAARPNKGGAAVRDDDLRRATEADQQLSTSPSVAYIPACAGSLRTYEDDNLKSSPFAYHLLAALQGGGAKRGTREVTTGDILDYLRLAYVLKRLPPPPEHEGFDRRIALGTVVEQETDVRRLMAISLLSAALDTPVADRKTLLSLAERQFARCTELHTKARLENLLSLYQCRRLADQHTAADELLRAIAEEPLDPSLAGSAAGKVAAKVKTHVRQDAPKPVPFHALAWGHTSEFAGLDHAKEQKKMIDSNNAEWIKCFSAKVGYKGGEVLPTYCDTGDGFRFDREIDVTLLKKAVEQSARRYKDEPPGNTPDLVLIYTGGFVSGDDKDKTLSFPFKPTTLWDIRRKWPGKATVVWVCTDGGLLGMIPPDIADNTSLLLLCQESNRALLDWGEYAIAAVRAGLTQAALPALHKKYLDIYQKEFSGNDPHFKPGTPAWVGAHRPPYLWKDSQMEETVGRFGRPDPSWSVGFARNADDWLGPRPPARTPTAAPDDVIGSTRWRNRIAEVEKRGPPGPFDLLEHAALLEAVREVTPAVAMYEKFTKDVAVEPVPRPGPESDLDQLRTQARGRLAQLAKRVEARTVELPKSGASKIRLVTVGVNAHESALIGSLVGCDEDIRAWQAALEARFPGRVVPYPIKQNTAAEVLDTVKRAAKECGPRDLLVFVFSGRGLQTEHDRLLITADTRYERDPASSPLEGARRNLPADNSLPAVAPAVSVSQLADVFAENKCVTLAILDCQFSWPVADTVRPDSKHIASILQFRDGLGGERRPDGFRDDNPKDAPLPPRSGNGHQKFHAIPPPSGEQAGQTFVWWSGTLDQGTEERKRFPQRNVTVGVLGGMAVPLGGNQSPASPFSTALIRALGTLADGTYEDLLAVASGPSGGEPRRGRELRPAFTVQGEIDRPLFAVGPHDKLLTLLLSDHYRRLSNLELAVDLAKAGEPLLDTPLDGLCRAAVLLGRAELLRAEPGPAAEKLREDDKQLAQQLLQALVNKKREVIEEKLTDELVALVSLAFRPDEALATLLPLLDVPGALTPAFESQILALTRAAKELDAREKVKQTLDELRKSKLTQAERARLEGPLVKLLNRDDTPPELQPIRRPLPAGDKLPTPPK